MFLARHGVQIGMWLAIVIIVSILELQTAPLPTYDPATMKAVFSAEETLFYMIWFGSTILLALGGLLVLNKVHKGSFDP